MIRGVLSIEPPLWSPIVSRFFSLAGAFFYPGQVEHEFCEGKDRGTVIFTFCLWPPVE